MFSLPFTPRRRDVTPQNPPLIIDEEEIRERSGVIQIGPHRYDNVDAASLTVKMELGAGTFGNVTKRVLHNHLIAVKEMRITDKVEERKQILTDLKVISKCSECKFIVKSYGYILTYDMLYICMETMAMCLEKLYQNYLIPKSLRFPEEVLGTVAVSCINALKFLKDSLKTIHRDIKPSNILINWNGIVKLCDFGIAGKLIDSLADTRSTGCVAYLSPERISGKQYGACADIWAFGITLTELAMCQYPYIHTVIFELMLSITTNPPPVVPDPYSKDMKDFVKACLQKDQALRANYTQLVLLPWFLYYTTKRSDVSEWLLLLTEEDEDMTD